MPKHTFELNGFSAEVGNPEMIKQLSPLVFVFG
jgi:hypothetical protein